MLLQEDSFISKSEFARKTGRSRTAITNATKPGAPLYPAMAGKKINIHHPAAKVYIEKAEIDKTNKKTGPDKKEKINYQPVYKPEPELKNKNNGNSGHHSDQNLLNIDNKDLENMTIKEVAIRFGGIQGFKSYIDSLKVFAEYKNKELMTQQKRNELVKRVSSETATFAILDLAFKRLLNEMPDSISSQLISLVKSGTENIKFKVAELIRINQSKILKDCKKEILKRIKEAEQGF